MRVPLPARLIIVKVIELQKSFLDTGNFFRPVHNTLTADDRYSLTSKNKWMETIQMHLSQKTKIFSNCFVRFSHLY